VNDWRNEMGVLALIQILMEVNEKPDRKIVLGNDGTSFLGKQLEGFVLHFESLEGDIQSRVLGMIALGQATAADIHKAFDDILDDLEAIARKIGVPNIDKKKIVSLLGDHASVPKALVNLFGPEVCFSGCGMHKGTNLCEAVCKVLKSTWNRPDGKDVIDWICCVVALFTASDKSYSKGDIFKSFLFEKEVEFLGRFEREVGSGRQKMHGS
jgi:hypothetical protein